MKHTDSDLLFVSTWNYCLRKVHAGNQVSIDFYFGTWHRDNTATVCLKEEWQVERFLT